MIVGIDASLTSTGIAMLNGDGVYTTTRKSTGKRNDTIGQRSERLSKLADDIIDGFWDPFGNVPRLNRAELVVIEGPTPGTRGGSVWDRAGLWWAVVSKLDCDRLAIVAPSTRAKWATGNGRSDKAAVATVAARLCPDVELRNSDEADALVLALMGEHAMQGDAWQHHTKYRYESLLKVAWPTAIAAKLLEPYEMAAEVSA